tara:strand:- start:29 stop:229 length:201 start_codon:yes stop_codon:yes gene_type:complete
MGRPVGLSGSTLDPVVVRVRASCLVLWSFRFSKVMMIARVRSSLADVSFRFSFDEPSLSAGRLMKG